MLARGSDSSGGQIRWATANFIPGTSGKNVGIPRAAVEEFHLKNGTWAGSPFKEEFEVRRVTENWFFAVQMCCDNSLICLSHDLDGWVTARIKNQIFLTQKVLFFRAIIGLTDVMGCQNI